MGQMERNVDSSDNYSETVRFHLYNAYKYLQQRKSKINVTVPAEWDDVEVVIPETIGEQGYESNRMKITNYSFYQPFGWTGSYYMHVEFKW